MDTQKRRKQILAFLEAAEKPVTGTELANKFHVSRQIVVGDVGVLRAMGTTIYATPRGYCLPQDSAHTQGLVGTVLCRHDDQQMASELQTIVDNGGVVQDVIVEHPLYGEIRAELMLSTRYEVQEFRKSMEQCQARPLSLVTKGVHWHTIKVPNQESLSRIREQLAQLGVLVEE